MSLYLTHDTLTKTYWKSTLSLLPKIVKSLLTGLPQEFHVQQLFNSSNSKFGYSFSFLSEFSCFTSAADFPL